MFTDTVSVGGEDVALPRHYGSGYTMNDYETKTQNVYLSASYVPTSKLLFTGTLNFNMSTGELDQVIFPHLEDQLEGDLEHQDFTFEEMNTYSNLDYTLMRFTFGMEYKLSPRVTFTADADYADLTDDSGGWVYGDESGSYLMIRSGLRLAF